MYIAQLSSDEWDEAGQHYEPKAVEQPGPADVEAALRRLDGKRWTVVTLEASEERFMGVGGGSDGRYLVYVCGSGEGETSPAPSGDEGDEDDEDDFEVEPIDVLLAPNAENIPEDAEAKIFIGGEETTHPLRHCVDLATALRAANTYAATGALDPSLQWEREEVPEVDIEWELDEDDEGE